MHDGLYIPRKCIYVEHEHNTFFTKINYKKLVLFIDYLYVCNFLYLFFVNMQIFVFSFLFLMFFPAFLRYIWFDWF